MIDSRQENKIETGFNEGSRVDSTYIETSPFHPASNTEIIDPNLVSTAKVYDSNLQSEQDSRSTQDIQRHHAITHTFGDSTQRNGSSGQNNGSSLSTEFDGHFSSSSPQNVRSLSSMAYFHTIYNDDNGVTSITTVSGRPAKRIRFDASKEDDGPNYNSSFPPPAISSKLAPSPSNILSINSLHNPLNSRTLQHYEGDRNVHTYQSPHAALGSPDLRRLSVNSLLSGPPGIVRHGLKPDSKLSSSGGYIWGIDKGLKDLDIGKNDDRNAILESASPLPVEPLEPVTDRQELSPVEFGFGMENNYAPLDQGGGYYDNPVKIIIPRELEPLPNKLLENPMNLLVNYPPSLLVNHANISLSIL